MSHSSTYSVFQWPTSVAHCSENVLAAKRVSPRWWDTLGFPATSHGAPDICEHLYSVCSVPRPPTPPPLQPDRDGNEPTFFGHQTTPFGNCSPRPGRHGSRTARHGKLCSDRSRPAENSPKLYELRSSMVPGSCRWGGRWGGGAVPVASETADPFWYMQPVRRCDRHSYVQSAPSITGQ